jgi:hypothetical protein
MIIWGFKGLHCEDRIFKEKNIKRQSFIYICFAGVYNKGLRSPNALEDLNPSLGRIIIWF